MKQQSLYVPQHVKNIVICLQHVENNLMYCLILIIPKKIFMLFVLCRSSVFQSFFSWVNTPWV